jgi:hypothetical protein
MRPKLNTLLALTDDPFVAVMPEVEVRGAALALYHWKSPQYARYLNEQQNT